MSYQIITVYLSGNFKDKIRQLSFQGAFKLAEAGGWLDGTCPPCGPLSLGLRLEGWEELFL